MRAAHSAQRAGHTIIIDRQPVRSGSHDMLTTAAMTHSECQEAMATGRAAALSSAQDGVRVLCVGEIGIGNTASAAALLCALTGATPPPLSAPFTCMHACCETHPSAASRPLLPDVSAPFTCLHACMLRNTPACSQPPHTA